MNSELQPVNALRKVQFDKVAWALSLYPWERVGACPAIASSRWRMGATFRVRPSVPLSNKWIRSLEKPLISTGASARCQDAPSTGQLFQQFFKACAQTVHCSLTTDNCSLITHHRPLAPRHFPLTLSLAVLLLAPLCHGQEIEPRRWSHMPIGANFAGAAYAYTSGDISLEPELRIQNATFDLQTIGLKYIRSFEVLGMSARVDVTQPYQIGHWSGLLNGAPAKVERDGLADTSLRFAVNLLGAPPRAGKEFAEYRAKADSETIVGLGIVLQFPTGQYFDDKLINLGNNRFSFRPQLGAVHNFGKWSAELTTQAWFFTDNDEFFNGKRLGQDPVYSADANLIYTFRPGLWLAGSLGYAGGGVTAVNGAPSDNRQSNLGFGLGLGIPISRAIGVKIAYIGTRTEIQTGLDTDTLTCAVMF